MPSGVSTDLGPERDGWIFTTVTDDAGAFRFASVPPGTAFVNSLDRTQVVVSGANGSVTEVVIVDTHHADSVEH